MNITKVSVFLYIQIRGIRENSADPLIDLVRKLNASMNQYLLAELCVCRACSAALDQVRDERECQCELRKQRSEGAQGPAQFKQIVST